MSMVYMVLALYLVSDPYMVSAALLQLATHGGAVSPGFELGGQPPVGASAPRSARRVEGRGAALGIVPDGLYMVTDGVYLLHPIRCA